MKLDVHQILKDECKPKFTDENKLGFGQYFTDYAFYMEHDVGKGWHDARIEKYHPLVLDPATLIFHYGQGIFEGLKAFSGKDGKLRLFRPQKHLERLNNSADRMCMPPIDVDFIMSVLNELLKLEREWFPKKLGTSIYIRPVMMATEVKLGLKVSQKYLFYIIMSPVGNLYSEGFSPIKILVERDYVRAAAGGVGYSKTLANYAASLYATKRANDKGFTQVLWLDACSHKYIEEIGTMNIFFKINEEVVTPALNGSILPGVTRDSVIQILKTWGIKVTERPISIEEVVKAIKSQNMKEMFGTGTAAIITPIGLLNFLGADYSVNDFKTGELSKRLYNEILNIQYGNKEDPYNWVVPLE